MKGKRCKMEARSHVERRRWEKYVMTDEHWDKREQRLRAIVHPDSLCCRRTLRPWKALLLVENVFKAQCHHRVFCPTLKNYPAPSDNVLSYIIMVIENINFLHILPFNFLVYSENISLRKITLPVKNEPEIIQMR